MRFFDRLAGRVTLIVALVATLFVAVPAAANEPEPVQWRAPEAAGAPFVADRLRSDLVIRRAELLRRRDTLASAAALLAPNAPEFTRQALDAEAVALERLIADLRLSHLENATSDYGIDIGIFPVDELRKPFYNDWREPRSGGRRHAGNDTLAHTGVPLRAIEDSTVERLTTSRLGGRTIYLIGESGARYYYAHLDEVFAVEPGDTVYAGEQIGTVGDTGNARGAPHLHLQWSPTGDSNWENPYPLLVALFGRTEPLTAKAYGPPNARS